MYFLGMDGTGSMLDVARAEEWREMLRARVPYLVDIDSADGAAPRPDLRSAPEHLANIRKTFNPAITDLAVVFNVSRQAIYKWINGEATPEPDKFKRIYTLGHAADALRNAGVMRASAIWKMKAFDSQSLMELAAADQLLPSHIQLLIDEARKMDAAYKRSGLASSKAKSSDEWRAELSIPGAFE
ncbi:MAG: helix-turn-helix domain-containing protein [Azoarcus sp.]|nr:helix-turn-helix domain-containing protein [Azoarcus sp.]